MALTRYSKKEPAIFVWVMIPYVIVLNLLIFGQCIFTSLREFLLSFLYSGIYFFCIYLLFGIVALFIKKRFPGTGELFKRIVILLPVFYVMNIVSISGVYYVYNHINPVSCTPNSDMMLWAILYGCIMSTFITFINEAVSNWEAWKTSLKETEQLRQLYQRSRVLGLKGQINPHFLFNCFNTLSGLIHENGEKAEMFLDEMTKVHRYLLSSNNELLVTLDMEIRFARSYLYLAEKRFGGAIQTEINVSEEALQQQLPPLSMHVILEHIIYSNALSKTDPLKITIKDSSGQLHIVNTLHKKIVTQEYDSSDGLDNLLNRYQMLNAGEVTISDEPGSRTISLPLFGKKEEAT